ncbi:MAG: AAA family ATPase, partial [Betaproteobacteria bacterium]
MRKLMRDLDTVKFIFVSFSHVISDRFLDVVSSNLGLEKKKTKVDMSQELTKYLLQRATDGQVVALLVDEAQNASDRGFEAICALSNLETDDEKLLQIVLVGQPELIIKLDKPSLRQVKQRVAIQHTVTGLETKSEIDHYIRHRLNVVGYNGPEIVAQEALDAIWDYSGGTPRLVNILCDNSLALASEAGNRNISGDVAVKAAEKFNLKRIVQLPTFADAETAVGGVADVGMAAEGNGASIGNGNGLDGSAISPASSEPAFIGPQQLSLSGELSINEEAVRLPAASEQASFGRSQDPSARHGKFTKVTGSLRGIRQTRGRNRFGIRWKIAGVFSALTLILSAVLMGVVYRLSEHTLREQLDKRALAVARNLSDASAGYILSNDLLALNTLLRKYTFLEEFAYAFVQDSGGAITAHTLETLPAELHQTVRSGSQRVPWRRELLLQGKTIYETSVPVLDGQIGVVHVGFWADAVEK